MMSHQEVEAEYERQLEQTTDVTPNVLDEAVLAEADVWEPVDLAAVASDDRSPMSVRELGSLLERAKGAIYCSAERSEGAMPDDEELQTNACTAVDRTLAAIQNQSEYESAFGHLEEQVGGTVWGELGLGQHSRTFDAENRSAVLEVATRVLQALVALEREALAEHAADEQEAALRDLRRAVSKAKAYGADDEAVADAAETAMAETQTVHPYAWPEADDGASGSSE